MTKHDNLAAALIAAQQEFGQIIKDKTAKIEGERAKFQYNYADINSVLEAVLPSLNKHGLALLCMIDSTENGSPVMRTTILHDSGEKLESLFPIGTIDSVDMRKLGSKLTYIRRYAIMAALNLASEDDDGQQASQPDPKEQAPRTTGASRTTTATNEPTPLADHVRSKRPAFTGNTPDEEKVKNSLIAQIEIVAKEKGQDKIKERIRNKYLPGIPEGEFSRKMLSVDQLTEILDNLKALKVKA